MKVLRILLLEDSLLDTELIQANLTDGGIDCELVRVETRTDFIAELEKGSFDLILSDYSLPSFDGISALEIARTTCPAVPFIFVSATLGEELAIETLKKGATDYVLKQRLGRLASVVHRALQEAKERRERKQAEAALQESQELFQTFMNNSPITAFMKDEAGHYIYVNRTVERVLNRLQADLIGKTDFDLLPPETAKQIRDNDLAVLAAGKASKILEVIPNHGGEQYWMSFKFPFKDASGRQLIAGMSVDITEQRRTEAALQASETKFKRLADSNVIGFIFWDVSGNITDANDAFLQMVGYTREDLRVGNVRWQDMTPPEYRHLDECSIEEMKKYGACSPFEKEYIRKDGSRVPVLLGGTFLDESHDKGVAFVIDVSDRKQLENQLRQQAAELAQANRIKDEFLAVLSHELRSPLNPILGWAKLLRTRKVSEATMARAIETIERNAQVQTQLIEDLLDVSRIMQGKISLNVCPVNLASTIEAATETVRLAAEAKSIEIESLIDATVGMVSGDPNRLQQVIWNLLSNAVKFTPPGGRVSILLERRDTYAQIQVSDTGKGIISEFLPYVFDYFRQADASTTRKFGGLGLGLAIVRHLVELHGGTISAASPGEGLGATFTVGLPLLSVPIKTSYTEQISSNSESELAFDNSPTLDGLRVLVVDDEADSREFITIVLERCGAECTQCAGASEAIQALDNFQPDVLVSDIGMPEEDGYTLIRKIRARSPSRGGRIPAAALTAYARAEDRTHALSAGFQMHLPKPVDPSELAIVVASLAGRIAKV